MPALHRGKDGITIAVSVIPHAPRNAVMGLRNDSLLVKVSASPEKGRANEAVLAQIAEFLGVSPSKLKLIRGHTSRDKVVLLQNSV